MRKVRRILITTALVLTVPSAAYAVPMAHITTHNTPDGRCHEDDPCWDCHTMGNRVCGTDPRQTAIDQAVYTLLVEQARADHCHGHAALEVDPDGNLEVLTTC